VPHLNRTLFLLGQADTESRGESTSVAVEGGSIVTKTLVGVVPILPYIMSDRTLAAHSASILIDASTNRPPANSRVNLFNLVGDADSSTKSLHTIQNIINAVQPKRCFNKPIDVFKTSRARLPKTLADIPRCIVPRVEAANPGTYGELQEACKNFNSWPIIVRAAGFHGGEYMNLLTDIADLDAIKDQQWLYGGIVLIEFIDYINERGQYQKNRVIMVDGVPYPRHAVTSNHWMVHAQTRAELMNEDLELCHREKTFLATGLQEYGQVFREIYQRIGLDIFGIDFAIVDAQIVIFEANACMKFLDRSFRADNRFDYLDGHVKGIKSAIKKMLLRS